MHFHDILLKIDNLTFIVLAIAVPVVGLGMSFRKVKSENLFPKLRTEPLKNVALNNKRFITNKLFGFLRPYRRAICIVSKS